ncbi:hypothetical protein BpHYR1_039658 [Brachionus plicatilis]|uniref:Uncharacterized protein n=1 Tax=Brachionus plicatilis TaxID=10195 RepID=A0A3M7T2J5_BRAPC|nr:hypothetical protein BpHYR1_039658 [Brachionus plicatilis]
MLRSADLFSFFFICGSLNAFSFSIFSNYVFLRISCLNFFFIIKITKLRRAQMWAERKQKLPSSPSKPPRLHEVQNLTYEKL